MDPQTQEFIQSRRNQGATNEQIGAELTTAGWNTEQIAQALGTTAIIAPPPPTQQSGVITTSSHSSMWDGFEHILMFISLYVSAISLGVANSYYISRYFPSTDYTSASAYGGVDDFLLYMLKGALAGLIVAYPIFVGLFLHITRKSFSSPELVRLKTRRVLIYLTLVVTFIIGITQIISLVFGLINGNVTLSATLHIANVLAIAGGIFAYYLFEVRRHPSP